MDDPDVWPLMLDMSRDDCKRILRRLELEAYSNLVSVFRAQGSLTPVKRRLLQNIAQTLSISEERHKAECRRAVNSEKLATIAKHMGGSNSGTEWAIEGRRLVPLLPRLVPQTAFTVIADKVANMAMTEGAKLPLPVPPVKKRLVSPPIDETLLEPSVPEASKTLQISSASPLSVTIPNCEVQAGKYHSASPQFCVGSSQSYQGPCPEVLSIHPSKSQVVPPLTLDFTTSVQATELSPSQVHEAAAGEQTNQSAIVAPSSLNHVQSSMQTVQPQQTAQKPQVVLLVKKEEKSLDERSSRKRPRSASLDMALNIAQGSMMPPPAKKEAKSPLSPVGMASPLSQLPSIISPQSHSHLVQQQTLQAAAAAVAAAARSSPTPTTQSQLHTQAIQQHQQYQQPLQVQPQQQQYPPTPTPQQTAPVSQPQQQQLPHHMQQHQNSSSSLCQSQSTSSSTSSGRTITIPSQGTVKLSLSSGASNTGSSISSGTHKVIIVSSTTPSILQRSLSVPVVKSLSTSAPSQPCSSTLVLNTAQQAKSSASVPPEASSSPSSQQGASSLPSKIQGKIMTQSAPKTRPRANSIVIPVTPNQSNMMGGVSVANVPLKAGLQTSKHGISKSSDTGGLKIMPFGSASKLASKTAGSSPMYVVSTTSTTNSSVSMVARTVSAGPRMVTLASNVPKVAVSSGQSGAVLSMTSKSAQTLQLAQASAVMTTPGSIPLTSASGKPNVIVVQKGSTAFGRGVTLPHGSKEVVGKVLLGGKALTALNQNQVTSSMQIQSTTNSPSNLSSNAPSSQPQAVSSQASVLPTSSSAPTRVVTVQKVPSAVVQGAASSGNVIVLDLSQEQLNNSAVLNEILASSILQSSSVMSFNHPNVNDSTAIPASSLKGLINFPSEQSGSDSGVLLSEGSIMVDELDDPIVSLSRNDICGMEDSITDEYSDALSGKNESSKSYVMGESSIYGGPSSNSANPVARKRTDICATAISNANLNLNDFLDDSIDDIQSMSLEGMRMNMASEMENTDENVATWTASEDPSTTSNDF